MEKIKANLFIILLISTMLMMLINPIVAGMLDRDRHYEIVKRVIKLELKIDRALDIMKEKR